MTMKQREKAIGEMKNEDKVKVMVAGLKCGGLGLNLNFANRIIITYVFHNLLALASDADYTQRSVVECVHVSSLNEFNL